MMTAILVTGSIVICLLVRVAITDICARTISNRDLAILLAASCLLILFTGKVPNIVLAVTVFSVGIIIFMSKLMGGGDIKLLTVLSLFFDWSSFASFLLTTLLFGGLIALVGILIYRQATLRLGVPYGVAIAIAFALSDTSQAIFFESGTFS